ncbi:MAG TPA: SDR family oxidoreductase [Solirubrobacter sp.]|nr:SDR family oxidoreductase [Solirubrobacter sp.]
MTRPIALVTGASRGIGRATAIRLAGDYDILAAARTRSELDALAREIASAGGYCTPIVMDVARPAEVAKALDGVQADVLVNNAGVYVQKSFLELTPEEWHAMVDVNLNALYHVTRAVLPGMIERRRGHVVVIGSVGGRTAWVGGSCYGATKHAVMGFTESLMLEVRDRGVKVSVVNPASVTTELTPGGSKRDWPLTAEQVADAVAYVIAAPGDVLIHRMEIRSNRVPAKR